MTFLLRTDTSLVLCSLLIILSFSSCVFSSFNFCVLRVENDYSWSWLCSSIICLRNRSMSNNVFKFVLKICVRWFQYSWLWSCEKFLKISVDIDWKSLCRIYYLSCHCSFVIVLMCFYVFICVWVTVSVIVLWWCGFAFVRVHVCLLVTVIDYLHLA